MAPRRSASGSKKSDVPGMKISVAIKTGTTHKNESSPVSRNPISAYMDHESGGPHDGPPAQKVKQTLPISKSKAIHQPKTTMT